jgi:CelD/BcsL family acetyltransferase involved in cellulose biosynthesis
VNVSIVRPCELGREELDVWRGFIGADPTLGNPFLAPEFTIAVGRVRQSARVAVLQDGGQVVGFLAFERHRLGVGKPIGHGLSNCQAVVHAPGLVIDPRQLVHRAGLDVLEFDHLIADQAAFAPYHVLVEPSPVIDLTEGYDAWFEARRSASRRSIRSVGQQGRRLERDLGPMHLAYDIRDADSLHRLIDWKSEQFRRTGKPDLFAQPAIVQLVEDLFEARAPGFEGKLSMLYAGDQPVAATFDLSSPTFLAGWFAAYDARFATYSPGTHLLLHMAREAAAAGIRTIDLGRGSGTYKDKLKSRDQAVAEGWVERPTAAALLRRAQRMPAYLARRAVFDNPALYRMARRTRRLIGRARTEFMAAAAIGLTGLDQLVSEAPLLC